jgi:hypothetical protein
MLRENRPDRGKRERDMDSLRGHLSDHGTSDGAYSGEFDDETGRELPPSAIGQDERRMQVRAYNLWASLLGNRNFPSADDLDPDNLPDFGPYSVLLDFTAGVENPGVDFLGDKLAEECGAAGPIGRLSDVPSRSLLSRITDHYMQILANQAPIGFEAEFVNQRGATILYRGILLPFSSDDDTIDFIYGVINWKELADPLTTDELLLEIDQALDVVPEVPRHDAPLTAWADGPADTSGVLELVVPADPPATGIDWPEPTFGAEPAGGAPEEARQPLHLADWLASARELAELARGSEERSRQALYAAIGRAYDFSLAAAAAPEEFQALVADAGLTVQDRAPMTPLVKLVFGADYDKTRLTEYAAALSYALRMSLRECTLDGYIAVAPGWLKGFVNTERRMRREESGRLPAARKAPREGLARKLRTLTPAPLTAVAPQGSEFALLVARRLPGGAVVLLGEVSDDAPLVERAARRLLQQG